MSLLENTCRRKSGEKFGPVTGKTESVRNAVYVTSRPWSRVLPEKLIVPHSFI